MDEARVAADETAPFRLLTRLFVRRLVDNDVISPHADRHEPLAVLYGLLVSLAVFATFFRCVSYLSAFIQLPGPAALSALSDRFLFIAGSISVSALGALMVWEALALEARDAAILGPLPIAARTITRAKLAAALIFGAVLTVSFNAVPSLLYPALLTLNMRGIRGATLLQLMAAHAVTVTMAGLLGFFSILAIRGTLRFVLGEQAFRRTSSAMQSALVTGMITALLLAPTTRTAEVREWLASGGGHAWPIEPVLWYVGANETLGGHVIADLPVVLPPRASFRAVSMWSDDAARADYRALRPRFSTLARRAWLALLLTVVIALATFLWTNRRLPDRISGSVTPLAIWFRIRRLVERHTQRNPEAEAGFFFALQTLARSAPHRTIVAASLAVGMTHALFVLVQNGRLTSTIPSSSPAALAISIGLLTSFLTGISHAVTLPADPAANWTFRLAWGGDERRYLAGVKRAARLLAVSLVVLLLPMHLALLGTATALVHSAFAILFATAAVDALFLPYRKLPFACGYVPIENPKFVWPAAFVGLLIVTYGFAGAESWALQTAARAVTFGVGLVGLASLLDALDRRRRRERRPVNFEGRRALATQRLGLFDHIASTE
jgi:hypothetical protein